MLPVIPEGMEIPDQPNIIARPFSRGGAAFDLVFETNADARRAMTPLPGPPGRRGRRYRNRKTRAELDEKFGLAELRRKGRPVT